MPSRSHMPSIHWFSLDSAGCTDSRSVLSSRCTVSSTLAPLRAPTADISSPAPPISSPSSATIKSPVQTPASAAGETLPPAVSTGATSATMTPSVLIWMPTTWPPATSS